MTAIDLEKDRFLRLKEVVAKTGLSEATIYRRMNDKTFPRSVQLGPACVRWLMSEVEEWARARVGERDHAND